MRTEVMEEIKESVHSAKRNVTQICSRCIYDNTIPYIDFDGDGVCNYCRQADQLAVEYPTGAEGERILEEMCDTIKKAGRGKKYDVVIGVSGGTDSSYMCHIAKEMGLRPLAAHYDNTWNSTVAVENIHNVLGPLGIDLFTHVVDNREANDLLRSFMLASTPDIDSPSDLGLATTHYLAARKFGIKYIFEGHSFRNEGIAPQGWTYMDARYIQTVQREFGREKLETFPNLWMSKWLRWSIINGIKKIRPLWWMDNDKEDTKKFLAETYGWQWYGGHHMENRVSYFTNNYYWPVKFDIDLRYCELSAQVRTGHITRARALVEIAKPHSFDPGILDEVKKRLEFSYAEFEAAMALPGKSYRDYRTYRQTFECMKPIFWAMYKLDLVPKSFYLKYTRKYDD